VTRAQVFQTIIGVLDDLVEVEIAKYLARRGYDVDVEDELRREMAAWRTAQIDEITKFMDALARPALH
jgi:hypothetical protein